jgi:hypothetical protein
MRARQRAGSSRLRGRSRRPVAGPAAKTARIPPVSPNHPAPPRRPPFLLSLHTLLATLAAIATSSAQAAPAPTLLGIETAVGRTAPLASAHVRPQPLRPLITRRVAAFAYDRIAVATGVAAKSADELLALPKALQGGPANVHVYYGVRNGQGRVYSGISNDVARRQAQHGDRFVLEPITTEGVTRGQARAIEEALIVRNPGFENIRHSISPKHAYYQDAVDWGNAWLRAHGHG